MTEEYQGIVNRPFQDARTAEDRVMVRRPHDAELPFGFAMGVGFLAAVLATTVAVAIGADHHPLLALLPLGLTTLVVAVGSGWVGSIATAWMCVLFDAGFVGGRSGRLDFTGDMRLSALVLVVIAVAGCAAGRYRWSRTDQRTRFTLAFADLVSGLPPSAPPDQPWPPRW